MLFSCLPCFTECFEKSRHCNAQLLGYVSPSHSKLTQINLRWNDELSVDQSFFVNPLLFILKR